MMTSIFEPTATAYHAPEGPPVHEMLPKVARHLERLLQVAPAAELAKMATSLLTAREEAERQSQTALLATAEEFRQTASYLTWARCRDELTRLTAAAAEASAKATAAQERAEAAVCSGEDATEHEETTLKHELASRQYVIGVEKAAVALKEAHAAARKALLLQLRQRQEKALACARTKHAAVSGAAAAAIVGVLAKTLPEQVTAERTMGLLTFPRRADELPWLHSRLVEEVIGR